MSPRAGLRVVHRRLPARWRQYRAAGGEAISCTALPGNYLVMALVFGVFVAVGLMVRELFTRTPARVAG